MPGKFAYPEGHYHSPVPDLKEVEEDAGRIWREPPRFLPGIDMREREQLALLEEFAGYYPEMPFGNESEPGYRYHFGNAFYAASDTIFLYSMLRRLRPRRVVEVGSGFTTGAILDVSERFLGGSVGLTVVDPHPSRVFEVLRDSDWSGVRMLRSRVQDVGLGEFLELGDGDVLFVDSSHVCKVGSDVSFLFFEVLPRLRAGVHVHFHDVMWPFEYYRDWVMGGLAWNEAYVLRAMLQGGSTYGVVAMNSFLQAFHEKFFLERMPLCRRWMNAGSIWIRKET